jgi:uncharacterized SAM-binding protein YcdF (DUF218 family)
VFFVVSKIFWLVASPVNLLLIVALAALVMSAALPTRARISLALAAVLVLAVLAATPIGLKMIAPLEDRFPPPPADMPAPDGIIVLGGAIRGDESLTRGQAVFSEGERVVEAAILARRFPSARVVFTGASGSLQASASTEAPAARKLLIDLGVDPSRIILEEVARNTDENARFTAALLQPRPGQRFLLVTSAYHMPRSMGLFEKAGFDVTAFPVAWRTLGPGSGRQWDKDLPRNLETAEIAAKEWIGLLAYWATGRIAHVFPSPADARVSYSPAGAPSR